jgi:hypothetical protein
MASHQFDHGPDRHPDYSERMNASTMSASSPRPETRERSQLGVTFKPSDSSVICGRGKATYKHPGNFRLRMLASTFAADYSQAERKLAKSCIVAKIVAEIRQEGGSFCKYEKGEWFEIGDCKAREKVSALLRDLLPTDYRSSTTFKKFLRRARTKKAKQSISQNRAQHQQSPPFTRTLVSKYPASMIPDLLPNSRCFPPQPVSQPSFDPRPLPFPPRVVHTPFRPQGPQPILLYEDLGSQCRPGLPRPTTGSQCPPALNAPFNTPCPAGSQYPPGLNAPFNTPCPAGSQYPPGLNAPFNTPCPKSAPRVQTNTAHPLGIKAPPGLPCSIPEPSGHNLTASKGVEFVTRPAWRPAWT